MVAFNAKETVQVSGSLGRVQCQRQMSVGNEMIGREKGWEGIILQTASRHTSLGGFYHQSPGNPPEQ